MELVHALSRGVDKRNIFLDDQDRFRFVHDLFEFNDQENVANNFYNFQKSNSIDIASRPTRRPRKILVDIHVFCLMNNHYHLLLSPRIENGVSKFMKKLNMGYVKYFNEKYKRSGTLFEGRYKSIKVTKQAHFLHLPYYIHFNPLDFVAPEWRDGRLKNYQKAIEFLDSYRWSSHPDYCGKKNFPSVTYRDFLAEIFGKTDTYYNGIKDWLQEMNSAGLRKIILE